MKRILLLLILSVCLLPLWPQETVTPVKPLSARIDALIEHKLPAGSNVAISVYDLTAGKPLYGYQADKLSRPASTMKLLTTITALSRPEADEPFRTEVWYQGTIERDTLQGDMYVIGGYDPEFDEEALDSLVATVARFPFSVIKGKVYGDVSMKDSLYWGSGWLWDDTPYSFQPYLSPLMLNKGVVKVTATPGERGDSARLECTPASSYYTLTNKTQSRTPSAGRFRVSRLAGEREQHHRDGQRRCPPCRYGQYIFFAGLLHAYLYGTVAGTGHPVHSGGRCGSLLPLRRVQARQPLRTDGFLRNFRAGCGETDNEGER